MNIKEPAYIAFANEISKMIDEGTYKPGDKLPSIRSLHKLKGISIGTILQSFNLLLDKRLIVSKEKTGYFVNNVPISKLPLPDVLPVSLSVRGVHIDTILKKIPVDRTTKGFISFANGLPDNRLLPFNSIKRAIQQVSRDLSGSYLGLENRYGNSELCELIAKRSIHWKGAVKANEIVTTNGAAEAILCCLKAVTAPGDTVLVQEPCFFGIMQILECLNLNVITIPSHPVKGIQASTVLDACDQFSVKACIFVSNFNNPDGATIDSEEKKKLAKIANEYKLPIIEDDLYGDLFFTGGRPDTIKTYDQDGWVLYCSSFTKTLAPGLRLGWAAAGRFTYDVARVKAMINHSTSCFNQRVLLILLSTGVLERHLQKFRLEMQKNCTRFISTIEKHFPDGTRITQPNGGLYLWVELPHIINTSEFLDKAFKNEISYAPGEVFSPKGQYKNYLRLSYSKLWDVKTEKALSKLGALLTSAYKIATENSRQSSINLNITKTLL